MRIDLLRHGPKNNDPKAHGTGIEALLDPAKIEWIREHARGVLRSTDPSDCPTIQIMTTHVDRSVATGNVEYEVMASSDFRVPPPAANDLIGSTALDHTDRVINLVPRAMSAIWAEAKKRDNYRGKQGEHRPLYAWFEQGLDNPQGWNPFDRTTWKEDDPGITLREIAWRIGAFLDETLGNTDPKTRVVAFGHSGDIEPWLALTLQMLRKKDDGRAGTSRGDMMRLFDEIGGALEPLTGVTIRQDRDDLLLSGPPLESEYGSRGLSLDRKILRAQAELYRRHGLSNQMLAARLKIAAAQ